MSLMQRRFLLNADPFKAASMSNSATPDASLRFYGLIPAAGSGERFHGGVHGYGGVPKQYQHIAGRPMLQHAITDALFGAAGLGDIGRHFPDSDPQYKGVDSRKLLRATAALLAQHGWGLVNLDATIIAQEPRMSPHVAQMAANIAADLGVPINCVNIKAKTTERLGFTGRGEGIAAEAVALIAPLAAAAGKAAFAASVLVGIALGLVAGMVSRNCSIKRSAPPTTLELGFSLQYSSSWT